MPVQAFHSFIYTQFIACNLGERYFLYSVHVSFSGFNNYNRDGSGHPSFSAGSPGLLYSGSAQELWCLPWFASHWLGAGGNKHGEIKLKVTSSSIEEFQSVYYSA